MLAPLDASAEPSTDAPDVTPPTLAASLAATSAAGVDREPASTADGGDPAERADDGPQVLAVAPVDAAAAGVSAAHVFSRGHVICDAAHDDTTTENNGGNSSAGLAEQA